MARRLRARRLKPDLILVLDDDVAADSWSRGPDLPEVNNHGMAASLDAVEEIFGALLDISRLDTGAMRAEFVSFRIDEMLRQLEVEFQPLAQDKGLQLVFMPCSLAVTTRRGS